MAHVKGQRIAQFSQDGKLALSVHLNKTDPSVKAASTKLAREYGVYNVPIHLKDTQFSRTGNGGWQSLPTTDKAFIVPPGACIEFHYSYLCHLGYEFGITVQPEGTDIVRKSSLFMKWEKARKTPAYLASGLRRFAESGSTIMLIDWKDFARYNIPVKTARQAWLIDFEFWPIYSYSTTPDGRGVIAVPQSRLEEHYASGISGVPLGVRKGHVTDGPGSQQKWSPAVYNIKSRPDLATRISVMALVVSPDSIGDVQVIP